MSRNPPNPFDPDRIARRTIKLVTEKNIDVLKKTDYVKDRLINGLIKNQIVDLYQHMVSGQHPNWKG